jgi:hypothetical protein
MSPTAKLLSDAAGIAKEASDMLADAAAASHAGHTMKAAWLSRNSLLVLKAAVRVGEEASAAANAMRLAQRARDTEKRRLPRPV